jgi:tRNA pseudouridine55 synthase
VTAEAIEAALTEFRGTIPQRPPAYSAISVGGQRLYDLARKGQAVEAPLRTVEITRLDLERWAPPVATLSVECSKGTYIRSLAHDLGQALGVGAHLSALTRTRVGPLRLEDATPLNVLEERLRAGEWQAVSRDPAEAVAHLPAVQLDAAAVTRLGHGMTISLSLGVPWPGRYVPLPSGEGQREAQGEVGGAESLVLGTLARAIGPGGELVAIVRCVAHDGALVCRPEKVLAPG